LKFDVFCEAQRVGPRNEPIGNQEAYAMLSVLPSVIVGDPRFDAQRRQTPDSLLRQVRVDR
jgi:hypothetical protein